MTEFEEREYREAMSKMSEKFAIDAKALLDSGHIEEGAAKLDMALYARRIAEAKTDV